jgi:hypothetical protein
MSEEVNQAPVGAPEIRKSPGILRHVLIVVLRAVFVLALIGGGWLVYRQLPVTSADFRSENARTTSLQIVMSELEDGSAGANIEVRLYPVDVVAVRHEYFTEPRAGKRWDDFLKERMRGRSPVSTTLDKQGRGSVVLPSGSWWLLAKKVSGDEEFEWRLPVTIAGPKQVIELTSQNAYTRSRTF